MRILTDVFLLLNCQNSVLERQRSVTLCRTTSDDFLGLDILSNKKKEKKLPSNWSPGRVQSRFRRMVGWLASLELEFRVEAVGREHVNNHAGRPHWTVCWAEA